MVGDAVVIGKIVLLVIIGPITFLASLIPWLLAGRYHSRLVDLLAGGSCLAGGVILGGAMSHLFPDAMDAFNTYLDVEEPYPYAPLIAVLTLFFLLCVDKLFIERNHLNESDESGPSKELQVLSEGVSPPPEPERHLHNHYQASVMKLEEGNKVNDGDATIDQSHRIATAYMFLFALSLHSLLDGLGLGSESTGDGFWGLVAAVLGHKLLDGFALGIPVFYARFSLVHSMMLLAFCAAMTPIGIGIGWASTSVMEGRSAILAEGIFLSLSLGSFFYIALIELLPAGLASSKHIHLKMAAAITGWALMAIIAIWA